MSTRVFGLPLAKSSEPWHRTDTETSLASAAALAIACDIGQRSRALEKNFACLNFRSSYFRIRDPWSIRNIRKLVPYENYPLYGYTNAIMSTYMQFLAARSL